MYRYLIKTHTKLGLKNNKAFKIFIANQFIFTILQIKILNTYLILN